MSKTSLTLNSKEMAQIKDAYVETFLSALTVKDVDYEFANCGDIGVNFYATKRIQLDIEGIDLSKFNKKFNPSKEEKFIITFPDVKSGEDFEIEIYPSSNSLKVELFKTLYCDEITLNEASQYPAKLGSYFNDLVQTIKSCK